MITELVVEVLTSVAAFVGSLFPTWQTPAWVTSMSGWLDGLAPYTSGLSPWIPWDHFSTVLGLLVAALGAALVIKLVRIVASFATFGGGSAA